MGKLKLLLLGLLVAGCVDKAEPERLMYAKCLRLQVKRDVEAAFTACGEAVGAAPNSTSGQKAAKVLADMKPAYEAAKAQRAQREAAVAQATKAAEEAEATRAKAAEEARANRAEARANRAEALRLKVIRKYYDDSPDSSCTGKGFPPYRWDYSGGTFAEDAEVADVDGCRPLFQMQENTTFCCPKSPRPLGF